jgi:hypothetical protein
MQSLFGRKTLKRSKSKDPSAPPVPAKTSAVHPLGSSKSSKTLNGASRVDEHGRSVHGSAPPAFVDTHDPARRQRSNSESGWRRSQDHSTEDGDEELQLCYGYWRVETERELGLEAVTEIVKKCGEEIKTRGMLRFAQCFSERMLSGSNSILEVSIPLCCSPPVPSTSTSTKRAPSFASTPTTGKPGWLVRSTCSLLFWVPLAQKSIRPRVCQPSQPCGHDQVGTRSYPERPRVSWLPAVVCVLLLSKVRCV